MNRHQHHRVLQPMARRGASMLPVLVFIAITSMLFGAVLTRSMNTYRQVSHIATWQESLHAAEAGAEVGMGELRKTLIAPTAFSTWSATAPDGSPLPNNGKRLVCPRLVHGGEGN